MTLVRVPSRIPTPYPQNREHVPALRCSTSPLGPPSSVAHHACCTPAQQHLLGLLLPHHLRDVRVLDPTVRALSCEAAGTKDKGCTRGGGGQHQTQGPPTTIHVPTSSTIQPLHAPSPHCGYGNKSQFQQVCERTHPRTPNIGLHEPYEHTRMHQCVMYQMPTREPVALVYQGTNVPARCGRHTAPVGWPVAPWR